MRIWPMLGVDDDVPLTGVKFFLQLLDDWFDGTLSQHSCWPQGFWQQSVPTRGGRQWSPRSQCLCVQSGSTPVEKGLLGVQPVSRVKKSGVCIHKQLSRREVFDLEVSARNDAGQESLFVGVQWLEMMFPLKFLGAKETWGVISAPVQYSK
ncbi:hypothetical protein NDU88_000957 [Pleurodeles waltl]|uniref:Uncharacterized protein n=1 Tax=Pleurodeles waltl TaxID=8319 RepID=A0AAV7TGX0_PLEWA|nr:hypothetical protein NDU88_000957 [Pleurodeles waltl]